MLFVVPIQQRIGTAMCTKFPPVLNFGGQTPV